MAKNKSKAWQACLQQSMNAIILPVSYEDLCEAMDTPYSYVSKTAERYVNKKKLKKAENLRDFVKRFLFLCNSAKQVIPANDKISYEEHLSRYISVIIKVTFLVSSEENKRCEDILTILVMYLQHSPEQFLDAILRVVGYFQADPLMYSEIFWRAWKVSKPGPHTSLYLKWLLLTKCWTRNLTSSDRRPFIRCVKTISTKNINWISASRILKKCGVTNIGDKNTMTKTLLKALKADVRLSLIQEFYERHANITHLVEKPHQNNKPEKSIPASKVPKTPSLWFEDRKGNDQRKKPVSEKHSFSKVNEEVDDDADDKNEDIDQNKDQLSDVEENCEEDINDGETSTRNIGDFCELEDEGIKEIENESEMEVDDDNADVKSVSDEISDDVSAAKSEQPMPSPAKSSKSKKSRDSSDSVCDDKSTNNEQRHTPSKLKVTSPVKSPQKSMKIELSPMMRQARVCLSPLLSLEEAKGDYLSPKKKSEERLTPSKKHVSVYQTPKKNDNHLNASDEAEDPKASKNTPEHQTKRSPRKSETRQSPSLEEAKDVHLSPKKKSEERSSPSKKHVSVYQIPKKNDNLLNASDEAEEMKASNNTPEHQTKRSPRKSETRPSLEEAKDDHLSPKKKSEDRLTPSKKQVSVYQTPKTNDNHLNASDEAEDPKASKNTPEHQTKRSPRKSETRQSPSLEEAKDVHLSPKKKSEERSSPSKKHVSVYQTPKKNDNHLNASDEAENPKNTPAHQTTTKRSPRKSEKRPRLEEAKDDHLSPKKKSEERLTPSKKQVSGYQTPKKNDNHLNASPETENRKVSKNTPVHQATPKSKFHSPECTSRKPLTRKRLQLIKESQIKSTPIPVIDITTDENLENASSSSETNENDDQDANEGLSAELLVLDVKTTAAGNERSPSKLLPSAEDASQYNFLSGTRSDGDEFHSPPFIGLKRRSLRPSRTLDLENGAQDSHRSSVLETVSETTEQTTFEPVHQKLLEEPNTVRRTSARLQIKRARSTSPSTTPAPKSVRRKAPSTVGVSRIKSTDKRKLSDTPAGAFVTEIQTEECKSCNPYFLKDLIVPLKRIEPLEWERNLLRSKSKIATQQFPTSSTVEETTANPTEPQTYFHKKLSQSSYCTPKRSRKLKKTALFSQGSSERNTPISRPTSFMQNLPRSCKSVYSLRPTPAKSC